MTQSSVKQRRRRSYETSHIKQVDQSVRENEATAYVHSMITEHSLSPASNNWVIVPAIANIISVQKFTTEKKRIMHL